jgi:hypothetical protein
MVDDLTRAVAVPGDTAVAEDALPAELLRLGKELQCPIWYEQKSTEYRRAQHTPIRLSFGVPPRPSIAEFTVLCTLLTGCPSAAVLRTVSGF